jgi:hypothetical protein
MYTFGDLNVSVFINPISEATSQTDLNRTINELESERIVALDRGDINRERVIAQKRMEAEELRDAIAESFKVDMSGVPVGQYRGALVVIGNKDPESTATGIVIFKKDNDGFGGSVHAELLFDNNHRPIAATPLKNCAARVGQLFTISVQVDGLGSDRLSGTALCNTFQVTATKGNLMQGSFKFTGSGPLS